MRRPRAFYRAPSAAPLLYFLSAFAGCRNSRSHPSTAPRFTSLGPALRGLLAAQNPRHPARRTEHIHEQKTTYVIKRALIAAINAAATLITLLALSGLAGAGAVPHLRGGVLLGARAGGRARPHCPESSSRTLWRSPSTEQGRWACWTWCSGGLATFLGAWCWKMRERPRLGAVGSRMIANALIVPAYLPLLLQGLGYYIIRSTSIALDRLYRPCTCSAWWPPVSAKPPGHLRVGASAALRAGQLRRGEEG